MTLGELFIFIALMVIIAKLNKLSTEFRHLNSIMDTAQLVKLQEIIDDTCDNRSD